MPNCLSLRNTKGKQQSHLIKLAIKCHQQLTEAEDRSTKTKKLIIVEIRSLVT